MNAPLPYLGEGLSLLCALLWGLAVVLFRKSGEHVHPIALNGFKNILATFLLLPTIWLFGETLFRNEPFGIYLILLLSGMIGIGFGDTLLFFSLNLLGAGLTGIVVCLYSPFIIMLSLLFLNEHMNALQFAGAALIVVAVLFSTTHRGETPTTSRRLVAGVFLGILASAAMAIGIVIVKPILDVSPLLWTTQIRLFGGIIALGVITAVHPLRRKILASLFKTQRWSYTISGSVIGAYLAMVVWLAGMKYAQASIASALNQTSTIFIFIFARIIIKEPMTLKRTAGIACAFIGSMLVSFG
jgi:drug/metabolite transporter (DMT)-like permease